MWYDSMYDCQARLNSLLIQLNIFLMKSLDLWFDKDCQGSVIILFYRWKWWKHPPMCDNDQIRSNYSPRSPSTIKLYWNDDHGNWPDTYILHTVNNNINHKTLSIITLRQQTTCHCPDIATLYCCKGESHVVTYPSSGGDFREPYI